jgi:plasmid replication initiation protein
MKAEIYKHNTIIGTASKITLQDDRYIQACLGSLYKQELLDKDIWYSIDVSYYSSRCGISKSQAYREFRSIATSLRKATVTTPSEGGTIEVGWINAILYNDQELTIAVKWNEHVIPFISGLKQGNYTVIHESAAKLSGINSVRLYELLKRCLFVGHWEVDVEDLQEQLGVNYKLFGDFKAKLLEPKLKEINQKTDIYAIMRANKVGKKVSSIYFRVLRKGADFNDQTEDDYRQHAEATSKRKGTCKRNFLANA